MTDIHMKSIERVEMSDIHMKSIERIETMSEKKNIEYVDEPMKKRVAFVDPLVTSVCIIDTSKIAKAARNGRCWREPEKYFFQNMFRAI